MDVAHAEQTGESCGVLSRFSRTTLGCLLGIPVGLLAGLGFFTFNYAEGLSYLSSDPTACMNCHIMRSQFDSWQKGSHHGAAKCVDCHLPHDFIGKYMAKSNNGYHHSKGFTLQDFHEPIMIKPGNSHILQDNCLRCHEGMVHSLVAGATTDLRAVECVHCHRSVGHGETAGLGGRRDAIEAEREHP